MQGPWGSLGERLQQSHRTEEIRRRKTETQSGAEPLWKDLSLSGRNLRWEDEHNVKSLYLEKTSGWFWVFCLFLCSFGLFLMWATFLKSC